MYRVKIILQTLKQMLKMLFSGRRWAVAIAAVIGYLLATWDLFAELLEFLSGLF